MQYKKYSERKISAGSFDLNKFLFGGYEKDIITTLYGPGASGKTNLAMLPAISQAVKGNKVVYIDTEGGFSIDRARQLLTYKNKPSKEKLDKTLQNILLLKPTTFEEQELAFGKLLKYLKQQAIALIIVDSITMLYRLELGDAIKQGDERIKEVNRKLAHQLRTLAEIARKQSIPVLVTNQVYSDFISEEEKKQGITRRVNMVGGDLLKYWSKCLIELQNFRGKRKLILRKHRSLPEKSMDFEIINKGIKKRGLF
ncbi:MAG: DNA repair and recombination protein RadB [Candidatus Nanoarchaeia archaeon]